jgi:hypothetical protein
MDMDKGKDTDTGMDVGIDAKTDAGKYTDLEMNETDTKMDTDYRHRLEYGHGYGLENWHKPGRKKEP